MRGRGQRKHAREGSTQEAAKAAHTESVKAGEAGQGRKGKVPGVEGVMTASTLSCAVVGADGHRGCCMVPHTEPDRGARGQRREQGGTGARRGPTGGPEQGEGRARKRNLPWAACGLRCYRACAGTPSGAVQ